jgi:cell division ATPase FtsA
MGKKENVVVGLDIGTTKTCMIVGEIKELGLDIIGIGSHPSEGLRKGVVVNIESTVESRAVTSGGRTASASWPSRVARWTRMTWRGR